MKLKQLIRMRRELELAREHLQKALTKVKLAVGERRDLHLPEKRDVIDYLHHADLELGDVGQVLRAMEEEIEVHLGPLT